MYKTNIFIKRFRWIIHNEKKLLNIVSLLGLTTNVSSKKSYHFFDFHSCILLKNKYNMINLTSNKVIAFVSLGMDSK